jgi:hypothetical protein
MTRVRIRGGYLNIGRRTRPEGPVDPDYGIDEGVDPDYGVDEGAGVDNELPIPTPPPGIWPPLTPSQPWRPIDPGYGVGARPPHVGGGPARPPVAPGRPDQGLPGGGGSAEQLPELPPGTIWPPLPPGVHGKYLALVLIAGTGVGMKYRYVVVDADARPEHPIAPEHPGHPDQGLPPTPQPKR